MSQALIDLNAVWDHHVQDVLTDSAEDGRNPRKLSASDLHSCDFALYERLRGAPQIPRNMATFSNFERGHAYEHRIYAALERFILAGDVPHTHSVVRSPQSFLDGISGHPDFSVIDNVTGEVIAVIDPTTTASKFSDWKYGHALKSASYAMALGCETFCEWVFCIGFGGNILQQQAHWFNLNEIPFPAPGLPQSGKTWRELVTIMVARKKVVAALTEAPDTMPPLDPLDNEREKWRCDKYCDTVCPNNKKLSPMGGK